MRVSITVNEEDTTLVDLHIIGLDEVQAQLVYHGLRAAADDYLTRAHDGHMGCGKGDQCLLSAERARKLGKEPFSCSEDKVFLTYQAAELYQLAFDLEDHYRSMQDEDERQRQERIAADRGLRGAVESVVALKYGDGCESAIEHAHHPQEETLPASDHDLT